MRHLLTAALAACVAASSIAAPAFAADMLRARPAPVVGNLPSCSDPQVLAEVEDQFEYGAPRVLEANLQILEFSGMFEKAYFPQVGPECCRSSRLPAATARAKR